MNDLGSGLYLHLFDYSKSDAYHLVSTPSASNELLGLGSVLPCSHFASERRFHRIWQEFHSTFLCMSPLEPPEVPLL